MAMASRADIDLTLPESSGKALATYPFTKAKLLQLGDSEVTSSDE